MTVEFGLSLRDEEQVAFTPAQLPEFCRLLELPGEVLDEASGDGWSGFCAGHSIRFGVRDLIDPGLSRRMAEESDVVRVEALRKLASRARRAVSLGARWASLDIDVGRAVGDPEYAEQVRVLLLQAGGMLARLKEPLPLLLPVRIPAAGVASEPEAVLRFRHWLPLPGLRLIFELHPHEPGATGWNGMEMLRFEAVWWRICFDPGSGNYLNAAALKKMLELPGAALPEPLRVLFSPEKSVPDVFLLEQLAGTAGTWEKEE